MVGQCIIYSSESNPQVVIVVKHPLNACTHYIGFPTAHVRDQIDR